MKNIFIGLAIGILLSVAVNYLLAFLSTTETIPNDYARVTIKNESGQLASRVQLRHGKGDIDISGLKDKEEVRLVFRNASENAYHIMVTFDNGSTLTSKEVYFENAYRGTETINASEVKTKFEK
jgi:hypothetical protein